MLILCGFVFVHKVCLQIKFVYKCVIEDHARVISERNKSNYEQQGSAK